jgi:ATP-dependent Clp protease ATP-binding subunit ClpA
VSVSLDTSVQLAWAIANTEANLADDVSIRPVHFLLGVLKLMDPSFASQLDGLDLSEEQRTRLKSLPPRGRQYLEMKPDDITRLRRGIRKKLRQGKQAHSDIRQLHRSSKSRQVFSRLAQAAVHQRQPCVDVMLLLQELVGTDAVDIEEAWRQVTGKLPSDGARRKWSTGARWEIEDDEDSRTGHPVDHLLTDLSRLARKGELVPVLGREREELSVCRLLNRTTKRNVLLVGDFGIGRRAIIEGLAQRACMPNARKAVARLRFYHLDLRRLLLRARDKRSVSLIGELAYPV